MVNGATDTAGAYSAVVDLPGCSGVLVAPRTVLTAAHCVDQYLVGCASLADTPLRVDFLPAGGIGPTPPARQRWARRITTLSGSVTVDVAKQCPALCQDPSQEFDAWINRGRDPTLLYLSEDAPAGVTPMKMAVHPSVVGQSPSFVAAPDVEAWVNPPPPQPKPLVGFVGYGSGSAGRDYGLLRLIGTSGNYGSTNNATGPGTLACPNPSPITGAQPGLRVIPDTMTRAQYQAALQSGPVTLAGVQSFLGAGDSGGPLLVGASQPLPPGGLPSGQSPSSFPGLSVPYAILGVASAPATSLTTPADEPPEGMFSPLYPKDVSDFLASGLRDTDGDGLPDLADPCPQDAGANADVDRDLIGDACPSGPKDPCPCSVIDDADHDGVCDFPRGEFLGSLTTAFESACLSVEAGERYDNCINVRNGRQHNCNLLAERGNLGARLGDACDPAPCPGLHPTYRKTPLTQPVSTGPFTINIFSLVARYDLDRIELQPVGSRPYPLGLTTVPEVDQGVPVPTTDYRFCFPDAATYYNYRCDGPEGYVDAVLGPSAKLRAQETDPNAANRWRRIWLHDPAAAAGSADQSDAPASGSWDYRNDRSYPRKWEWASDFAFWQSRPWFGLIGASVGQGGVLGSHGETQAGQVLVPSTATEVLYHFRQDNLGLAATGLANGSEPLSGTSYTAFNWSLLDALRLPLKVVWFGAASGSAQGGAVLDAEGGVFRARDAEPVLAVPGRPDIVGVLEPDGQVREVNARLGAGLRQALADGVDFLTPAEPSPHLGRSDLEPLSVAVSRDRRAVTDEVVLQGGALLARSDRGLPPRQGAVASATGGVPVYSRSRGMVWVVGAMEDSGQRSIRWARSDGTLAVLPTPGLALDEVTTATFEPTQGRLWLLSTRTNRDQSETVRLTSVDVATGASQVHIAAARTQSFDSRWLVADHDGHLLFVASRLGGYHVVVRLSVAGAPAVVGVQEGYDALAFAPAVDPNGYSFPLRSRLQLGTTTRLPSLTLRPGTWAELTGYL